MSSNLLTAHYRRAHRLAGFAIAIACFISAVAPASAEAEEWTIRRDRAVDGRLVEYQNLYLELEWRGGSPEGVYIESPGLIHHQSRFRGETHHGRSEEVLFFHQTNPRGYQALHIGRKIDGEYVGSWLDNEGNHGDFRLIPGTQGEVALGLP